MNIARPSGGFEIVVESSVQQYILSETKSRPLIKSMFDGIILRIKFTALKEGVRLEGITPPAFTYISAGNCSNNVPTIQIVFRCFGEILTIYAALVLVDGEDED